MIESRICQNCKTSFAINDSDFVFYEKMKVPPPTFCPACRAQRRMVWRNERSLYKRSCDLCSASIISIYSPASTYKVYCRECFHGDKWDPMTYGQDYDFSRPLFEQLRELQLKVPRQYAFVFQNVNSEYVNGAAFNKNCYLIFVSDYDEDSLYSYRIMRCKNTSDCYNSTECELCYECVACKKCYRTIFSEDCSNCQSVIASKNCANCQDCVGCVNLRNKQYHIFNEPYTKETYFEKIKTLRLDTRQGIAAVRERAKEIATHCVTKYIHGSQNMQVTGDYVFGSKASAECYGSDKLEDCKFVTWGDQAKDCYDAYVLVDNSTQSYEVVGAVGQSNVACSALVWSAFDVRYSDSCESSNNLFGCVSLRKKQYCILNKQYSKEEYEALVPKIIEHMKAMPYVDARGIAYRYGEFFPPMLAPFAYNETAAQENFLLTEREALTRGYRWHEAENKNYQITMTPEQVPVSIADVGDDVQQQIIGCAHRGKCSDGCTTAFRIVPQELQLYRSLNIPLPTLCFNCRHFARLKQKNPSRLWQRDCQCGGAQSKNEVYKNTSPHAHGTTPCLAEFETSYAPDRPEIVYCEACYQQEVA